MTGGGSVGYCNKTSCSLALAHGLNYPNGLVRGPGDYIYIPSSITGKIHVTMLTESNTLRKLHTIRLPYPIDNLSVDSKGDIYAATFPKTHEFIEHQKRPYDVRPPAAVWRIRKMSSNPSHYETVKVLEGSGDFLPSATVAIHDPVTKRFFLGGTYLSYRSSVMWRANDLFILRLQREVYGFLAVKLVDSNRKLTDIRCCVRVYLNMSDAKRMIRSSSLPFLPELLS